MNKVLESWHTNGIKRRLMLKSKQIRIFTEFAAE